MRIRRERGRLAALAVSLCALGLAAAPAAAPAAVTYGIADQHAATFRDPQFHATGMAIARLNSPWDALSTNPGLLDAWLTAARDAGVEPMIAFNRSTGSRCPSAPCVLPSLAQYGAAFDAFRARYPWVTTFTPWNEVNDPGQPTVGNPARAAGYYKLIKERCPSCTVLGADVIDNGSQLAWLTTFLKNTPVAPRLWGLHNYVDVNYFRTTGTEKSLAAMPGEVWLTETAGLVKYTDRYGVTRFPYDEERAARATAFLLSIVDAHPTRITRLYHYGWRQGGPSETFDTGLLRNDGTPRPALAVLRPRLPGRPAPP
ncbi:MAG: glycosyl hydrolase, partial [Actinomycetota bacterium]|nr:glycosyl hydrolase [Actinomycetota bacterium]